jgi:hypothetical protein
MPRRGGFLRDRPFSDISASREQTVYMGKAGSAVSGILYLVLPDSAGFAPALMEAGLN